MDQTPLPDPDRQAACESASAPRTTRLSASRPEDFVAFAPLALGFVPDNSVVMLTFGEQGRSFHARLDLPDSCDELDEVVEALLRPALRHRVRAVVFLVYDDDTATSDEASWSLRDAFVDEGIDVLDVIRVWAGEWFAVLPGHPPEHYRGVPFDLSSHPFTAQGVLDGRVTRASREELRASLDALPERVATLEEHLEEARPLPEGRLSELVLEHLAAHTPASDADLASIVLTLAQPSGRDDAWSWLTREHAAGLLDFWSDAVRRTPGPLVASPAAVLAFTAWLAGDGALAWCAVDRCRAVDEGHTLAGLVAELLTSATSPEAWAAMRVDAMQRADPAA